MFESVLRTLGSVCLASLLSAVPSMAVTPHSEIATDFSSNPLHAGWEIHGDPSLFAWNAASQNLQVTWDSSKTNSYFRIPLPSITTSENDFAVTLDLLLNDIQIGVRPQNPGTFQIAFGFQNRAHADQSDFIRGTGANTPNLVEFNFMPDSGFGATVWPAMFPTNGLMNYSGAGDFSIFELPVGALMQVTLAYTASNHLATLTITTNGTLVGPVTDAPLVDTVKGFILDAFAISSYSDAGQDPFYPGSILAHGIIDNIQVTAPPSPVRSTHGQIASENWEQSILTVHGWNYILEGTTDFSTWTELSERQPGIGDWIQLRTPLATQRHQFFRVKAVR